MQAVAFPAGWVVAAAALGGLLVGLLVAKAAQSYIARKFDPHQFSKENAELRAKVRCCLQEGWEATG